MHLRAMYRHAHGNYGAQAERDHSLSKALPWMHVCTEVAVWLESAIDKAANSDQWTGDVSKQGPYGFTCFGPRWRHRLRL